MDIKIKGRTWVGNIFHKFEAMCQEVDDFVNKDSVKYVENQVQTVSESVKRIYSNVVHDFVPPLEDDKEAKAQAVAKIQNDSIVGVKEKHTHASDRQSSTEQVTVHLRSCDASEVDCLRQFSLLHSADSPEVAESDSFWEEGSDEATNNNSTALLKVDEEGNFLCPSDISNDGGKRRITLAKFPPGNLVEDVWLSNSQKDKMAGNKTDPSEEAETGLSLKQDFDPVIYSNSEMFLKKDATIEEHPASEHANCLEDKNSCELLCTKEQHPAADDLHSQEDKNSYMLFSTDEDHKSTTPLKQSPEIWVPERELKVVRMEETAKDNADISEEAGTNLFSVEDEYVEFVKTGMGLEVNVKNHLVVEYRSSRNNKSSSELSLHSGEQHPLAEDSSTLEAVSLHKSSMISTNQDKITTLDKLSTDNSVNEERLRVFQEEEGVCNRTYPSKEAETDLSLDVEENDLVEKHAMVEYLGSPEDKDSCYLSLCFQNRRPEIDYFDCPKCENSSESSLISRAEDHTSTIRDKFLTVTSVHDARIGSSQKDEAVADSFSDVLSSDLSSELVSLNSSWEHNVTETEASSSSLELLNPVEISHANCTPKTQKICCDYTDSSGWASYHSNVSSASFSGSASGNKAVNLIPAFPRNALSAGILDDSAFDIADANMETIDLSDKAKLEESCVVVDNELFYAASCRPRKFRSYKELIKEAFASRKRLIKEYEQLAIWSADIDTDISLHAEQCLSPHVISASRTLQTHDTGESEWEIL